MAEPTSWECSRCHKINAPHVNQCACPSPLADQVIQALMVEFDRKGVIYIVPDAAKARAQMLNRKSDSPDDPAVEPVPAGS